MSYILPLTADEVQRRLLKVSDLAVHTAVYDAANSRIQVVLDHCLEHGSGIKFKAPVDCAAITKLQVQYVNNAGTTESKVFAFADANGNDVGEINNLFGKDSIVKVILDLSSTIAGVDGAAFVQNADTNAYLESRFAEVASSAAAPNTAAGHIITIDDAAKAPLRNLKIYGKTIQNGTPAADAPVDLVSVGDSGSVKVTIGGKNLFDSDTIFAKFGFTKQTDGSWLAYNYHGKVFTPPVDSKQMFLRVIAKSTGAHTSYPFAARAYYTDGTYSNFFTLEKSQTDWIELQGSSDPAKTISSINFTYGGSVATQNSFYIRDLMLSYAAEIQTLTVPVNSSLCGIPVAADGNYTDDNGQQWICDEIDLGSGLFIKRIGVIESYTNESISTAFMSSTGELTVGAKVFYVLDKPATYAVNDELYTTYPTLYTHAPNTTVYNDASAWMEVSYYSPNSAVPMIFSAADAGKVLAVDEHGAVALKPNPGRRLEAARLSETEKNSFANINWEAFLGSYDMLDAPNLDGLANWAYNKIGVSVNEYIGTVHETFSRLFDAEGSGSARYKLLSASKIDSNLAAMLLEKSYGGGAKMSNHGYTYGLTSSSYAIGDIFCMRYQTPYAGDVATGCYYIAFYLGNDTFALYSFFTGDIAKEKTREFAYVGHDTLLILMDGNAEVEPIYYFALRPDNLAVKDLEAAKQEFDDKLAITEEKIAQVNTRIDTQLRDLNVGKLTDAEKAKISSLTTGTGISNQLPGGAVWVYKQAGIDISPYITKNVNDTATVLFYDRYILKEGTTPYHTMLVPDSCGGTGFTSKGYTSHRLPMSEYQVGDIFCGRYKASSNMYWAAVYQGNNKFIVRDNTGSGTNFIVTYTSTNTIYDANPWLYYYVLRPERIVDKELLVLQDDFKEIEQIVLENTLFVDDEEAGNSTTLLNADTLNGLSADKFAKVSDIPVIPAIPVIQIIRLEEGDL